MDELAHQPGRTVQILTVELLSSARTHVDHQHLTAAGAYDGDHAAAASGVVLRNLRDDHIRLIDGDFVTRPQRQLLEDVQVVQVGVVNGGAVNLHVIEHAGEADHTGPGGGHLQGSEYRLIKRVRPFQGHQPVLMVPGGPQGAAIGQVVKLEDQAVHRESIFLRAIDRDGLFQGITVRIFGQYGITYSGEAHLGHKAQVFPFGRAAQMVADQVEGQKLQPALLALPGVQFSDTAGSQVPGMGVRFLQGLVEFLEILPTDNALTAHLQRLGAGDGQRYVLHDPDGMGDILTLEPIAAGNGLNQLAAHIAQHQRQSVQLPADDHPPPADELEYLAGGLGLVGREHGPGVGYCSQALQHLSGHPLGGRRG